MLAFDFGIWRGQRWVREEIQKWIATYPKRPGWRDGTYAGADAAEFVRQDVANGISSVISNMPGLRVRGSAGDGDWTHTPWVSILEPAASVEDGVYVVYLLSHGCSRLYLSIAQGVTHLYRALGKRVAAAELRRRAEVLRPHALHGASRLSALALDLQTHAWRGQLYEASSVIAVAYDANDIPTEGILRADLREAIQLCRQALPAATWGDATEVLHQARRERGRCSYEEAKRYGYHRRIERNRGIPKAVKAAFENRCGGCQEELADRYGPPGSLVMEVHHLKPLANLDEGEAVKYAGSSDFALLCPNCHRVIHRMSDVSDVDGLRDLIAARRLTHRA